MAMDCCALTLQLTTKDETPCHSKVSFTTEMTIISRYKSISQIVRYGVVGLVSNALLYLLYLALTGVGLGHKSAMTLLFALGIIQTYLFNKRWTFGHRGFHQASFLRYVIVYSFAYFINLTALLVLVDNLGYSHEVVQAAMIVSISLIIFLLQKFWVFRSQHS